MPKATAFFIGTLIVCYCAVLYVHVKVNVNPILNAITK